MTHLESKDDIEKNYLLDSLEQNINTLKHDDEIFFDWCDFSVKGYTLNPKIDEIVLLLEKYRHIYPFESEKEEKTEEYKADIIVASDMLQRLRYETA